MSEERETTHESGGDDSGGNGVSVPGADAGLDGGPEDGPPSRDIVSWVLGGLIAALLVVNVINYLGAGRTGELVGGPAPDVSLPEVGSEETIALSNFRGQVVLMDFWATWCPPCHRQMDHLGKLANDESFDTDYVVLSVNTDDPSPQREKKVRAYLQQRNLDFKTVLDNGTASRQYGVQTIPTLVLVGPDGKVTYADKGVHPPERLKKLIEKAAD